MGSQKGTPGRAFCRDLPRGRAGLGGRGVLAGAGATPPRTAPGGAGQPWGRPLPERVSLRAQCPAALGGPFPVAVGPALLLGNRLTAWGPQRRDYRVKRGHHRAGTADSEVRLPSPRVDSASKRPHDPQSQGRPDAPPPLQNRGLAGLPAQHSELRLSSQPLTQVHLPVGFTPAQI